MNEEDFKIQIRELKLEGTKDKKDIVILKFLEDVMPESFESLQQTISAVKQDIEFGNVSFIMLPSHITLTKMDDDGLRSIGLQRIPDE